MKSKLMSGISEKKKEEGDDFAIILVDLCFVTSYKIEELIAMPPKRLNLLIERFRFHYEKKGVEK